MYSRTSDGSNFRLIASGDGWTVRNVGIRGRSHDTGPFVLSGSGTVRNVYAGDGGTDGLSTMGCWIDHNRTDGPINFHHVHFGHFTNNGIYGSPTVDTDQGGIVNIYDSYFDTNNIANFKIGSPLGDCEVVRTTMRTDQEARAHPNGTNARTMWALDGHTILRDCDVEGRIAISNADRNTTVELDNTRFDGEAIYNPGHLQGTSAGQPDLSPPDGVPMDAETAAAGLSGGDGGDGGTTDPEPQGTIVEIIAPEAATVNYEFTTDGPVTKAETSSDISSIGEDNDEITDNGDGTYTVTGSTGNGFGDAFEIDGSVIDISSDTLEYTLRIDGTVRDPTAIGGDTPTGGTGGGPSGMALLVLLGGLMLSDDDDQ